MNRSILTQLLTLAWPIIISRSTQVIIGLSDALMVAQLGEAALAATTTGAFNSFSIFILPMGIVFIVSSFASQFFGRQDFASARRYGWYGMLVAGIAQVAAMLGCFATPTVVHWLSYAPDVEHLLNQYIVVRLLSAGAVVGTEALANYYGGIGNTRLPMLTNVLAMVLNVLLNWVFIFGHLGSPPMGVLGAALASSLSTGIAFVVLFTAFWRGYQAPLGDGSHRLSTREFTRMLRFGAPHGLNWFFEFAAFAFFINVVVAGLGTTALAAMMAVLQLHSVAFMPAFGLASAGAILVGQAIGGNDNLRVPRLVYKTMWVAAGWQGFMGLLYLVIPAWLIGMFSNGEGGTRFLEIGTRMLMMSSAWQIFDALATVLSESLRAAGDTAYCLMVRLLLAWLFFVPASLLVVQVLGGGELAAILCCVVYLAMLAAFLLRRFRSGFWQSIRLTGDTALPVVTD